MDALPEHSGDRKLVALRRLADLTQHKRLRRNFTAGKGADPGSRALLKFSTHSQRIPRIALLRATCLERREWTRNGKL